VEKVKAESFGGAVENGRRSLARLTWPKAKRRQIPLRFVERKLLLAGVDLVLINVALYLSLHLRPDFLLVDQPLGNLMGWSVTLSVAWLIMAIFLEVYDLAVASRALHSAWLVGWAALAVAAAYELVPLLTPGLPERRLYIFLFPLLAAALLMTWRISYAHLFVHPTFRHRALVVGAGWAGRTLAEAIALSEARSDGDTSVLGYELLGFIDDDAGKQGRVIAGVPVLGTRHEVGELLEVLQPDEIIVAITDSQSIHPELFRTLLDSHEKGVALTTMASLYERLTGRVPVEHAGRNLHVVLPIARSAALRLYLAMRRLLDVVLALIGCLLMGIVSPLIWLANRAFAPGDLFYSQERIGKSGKPFRLLKYRSMVMDAERDTGIVWADEDDDRVTPVGRFLRRTRLDELPQVVNVLRGEMSIVGPRPERPAFVGQLMQELPFYRLRHSVRPGITGWAQVMYRYGASVEDALMKLQYDLYYIKHQGPYLDLLILFRTVRVMLGLKGR